MKDCSWELLSPLHWSEGSVAGAFATQEVSLQLLAHDLAGHPSAAVWSPPLGCSVLMQVYFGKAGAHRQHQAR